MIKNFPLFLILLKAELQVEVLTQEDQIYLTELIIKTKSIQINFGPLELNLNYRYIGDHLDWTGSKNEFVKSVDLIDLTLRKKSYGNIFSLI